MVEIKESSKPENTGIFGEGGATPFGWRLEGLGSASVYHLGIDPD